jgi:hypothetical protein
MPSVTAVTQQYEFIELLGTLCPHLYSFSSKIFLHKTCAGPLRRSSEGNFGPGSRHCHRFVMFAANDDCAIASENDSNLR